MPDLGKAAIPLDTAASEASLAVRLLFKFLALLRETGKVDDGDVRAIASGLIADLGSDAERAAQWRMLEQWLPEFERDPQRPEAQTMDRDRPPDGADDEVQPT